jgi:N,N-dimethylformamidase
MASGQTAVPDAEPLLQGYLSEISLRPGGELVAHVSSDRALVGARVVRLLHGDPSPNGPGAQWEETSWLAPSLHACHLQRNGSGSYAIVPRCLPGGAVTLTAWVFPTLLERDNVVCSWPTATGSAELVLTERRLVVRSNGHSVLAGLHRLHERQWYFLGIAVDVDDSVRLFYGQLGRTGGPFLVAGDTPAGVLPRAGGALLLGARSEGDGAPIASLDGKVAAPCLIDGCLDVVQLMDLMNRDLFPPGAPGLDLEYRARWDLGDWSRPEAMLDVSGNRRHGELVNAPTRAVTDHTWAARGPVDGVARAGLGAVHFHTDDLDDCGWEPTLSLSVPDDARSGFYSLRLRTGPSRSGSDPAAAPAVEIDLPFVVAPGPSDRRHHALMLAPTYTWQAYANLGRDIDAWPGPSLYALHRDGSAVFTCSRRKPTTTFAPGAYLEVDGGDGFAAPDAVPSQDLRPTHLLMADLYVHYWLETTGVPFAVATDEQLHAEGADLLDGVNVVVLSAHPEYWTGSMLDTLAAYLERGGNLVYLGGNGLYWVTSVHPAKPHLIEVRREGGSQTAAADAGEAGHAFERVRGGPWRANGRPPNTLLGVGFTAFGWDRAIGYRRTPLSYEDRYRWVFDGVGEESIGGEGLVMGGAAAIELDRADPAEGSAAEVAVLASAVPDSPGFFRAFEHGPGRAPDPLVRCDLTLWELPSGGRVFALGSIAAAGCLPVRGGDNALAKVCTNVLRSFAGTS